MAKCKHKWIQIQGVYVYRKDANEQVKKGEMPAVEGVYVFCEHCHETRSLNLRNSPIYEYPLKTEMKKEVSGD